MNTKMKALFNAIFYSVLAVFMMLNYVDDGNLFAIFIEKNRLVIGDFWSSLFIMYLSFKAMINFKKLTKI